eukprot:SAG11_NODE_586_length_8341_cov_33.741204_9_plen_123_part_00
MPTAATLIDNPLGADVEKGGAKKGAKKGPAGVSAAAPQSSAYPAGKSSGKKLMLSGRFDGKHKEALLRATGKEQEKPWGTGSSCDGQRWQDLRQPDDVLSNQNGHDGRIRVRGLRREDEVRL